MIRQRVLLFLVLGVLAGGAIYLFSQVGGDDEAASNEITPEVQTTASTDAPTDEPVIEEIELVPPTPGASIDGPTPCPAEDGSSERTTTFSEAPPMCIDPTKSYTAVVGTAKGDITIALDPSRAPLTVNNFVVLARYGYYEGVPFHRIIPDFVVQGGDAVGPTLGIGGPGYTIEDELPEAGAYEVGSLAMANSGPNTNGSQFFIVSGDAGMNLPPQYSLFGQITEGLETLETLDSLGSAGAGKPLEEIIINGITVTEG